MTKFNWAALSLAVLGAWGTSAALAADDATATRSREDVRAEARQANRDGSATPKAERAVPTAMTPGDRSRESVRSEAAAAERSGTVEPGGKGEVAVATPKKASDRDRMDVRAEARAANGKAAPAEYKN